MALIKNGAPSVDSVTGAMLTQALTQGAPTGVSASRHVTSAATVNGTSAYVGAAVINFISALNTTAAAKYLRIYDKASAPATTDVPKATFQIPANGSVNAALNFPVTTGVAFNITGAAPDNDATVTAVGDVIASLGWLQ